MYLFSKQVRLRIHFKLNGYIIKECLYSAFFLNQNKLNYGVFKLKNSLVFKVILHILHLWVKKNCVHSPEQMVSC